MSGAFTITGKTPNKGAISEITLPTTGAATLPPVGRNLFICFGSSMFTITTYFGEVIGKTPTKDEINLLRSYPPPLV